MGLTDFLNLLRTARGFGFLLAALAMFAAAPVRAQQAPPPPMPSSVDERGVDLISGTLVTGVTDIAIGPSDYHGLSFSRVWVGTGWRISGAPTISGSTTNPVVSFDGHSIPFQTVSGAYVPMFQDGSALSTDRSTFTGADGTIIQFAYGAPDVPQYGYANLGSVSSITFPDGTQRVYHYEQVVVQATYCLPTPYGCQPTTYDVPFIRLSSITTSTGYELKFGHYETNISGVGDGPQWSQITSVTAINNAVEYCDPVAPSCSLTGAWPQVTYTGWVEGTIDNVTSPSGLMTQYTYTGGRLTGVTAPGESTATVTIGYNTSSQVSSIAAGGGTWAYTYPSGTQTTLTDPLSHSSSIVFDGTGLVTSATDAASHTTNYAWCTGTATCPAGLLQTVTMPEGNQVTYAYDARGNMTTTTSIAKGGTGLANIVTSAAYPSSCTNVKTCNQPSSTTDAGGNVTSYTYDTGTGLVTRVETPAATTGGARPTTNYVYASKQSRYLTGPSTWSNSSVTVLTETNTCRTAATCAGTANQARTILSYPASTTANNLQPISVEQRSGDGTLSSTTAIAYDSEGRVSTVDGPLSGTNDQAAVFYDAAGVVIGKIGADPDGAGGNPRPAVRYTYNAKGQLTTTESGTVTALTQAALTGMTPVFKSTRTYDANRRLKTAAQVATSGTTQYSITQYSYDALGRADCTAVRMNAPLTTTTLPASACTAMTAGSYGQDRIGQTLYNALGQVASVKSGVGTSSPSLVQTTAAYTYTNNGRVQTVTDANGNTTTYVYDGFDRPLKTQYPDKTTGNTNTSDYEQLTYGNSTGNEKGRVTGYRSRLGESFSFAHDLLGRTTQVTVPDRSGLDTSFTRDVYYGYDVASDMLSARFDSTSGSGITYAYDAFGRPTSTTDSMFAAAQTLSYGYDVAGNRTTVIHPDSTAFSYVYDSSGRLTGINLGSTQLAGFTFNTLGQLTTETRYSSAPGMSYTYDAAGRLATLAITGAGSNNVSWSYSWNPAGEEISSTRDNDLYAFTGSANVNRAYDPNGLNQYDTVGSDPITYDTNGNLANDNHTTFAYDPQNMLVSASGGNTAALHYDPLGRLFSVSDGTNTTQFLYDGDDLVGEYNGSGTLLDRYIHGVGSGDDPVLGYDGSGTADTALRQLYADRLGSVVLTTGYTGTLTGRGAYDDWGIPDAGNLGVGASGEGRFQYTGQAWVPELGMFHYKARMYSPVLGRFMQTDPIGYGDGLNIYRYVGNNPLNGADPTGMADITLCGNRRVDYNGAVPGDFQCPGCDPAENVITVCGQRYAAPPIADPLTTTIDCANGGCDSFLRGAPTVYDTQNAYRPGGAPSQASGQTPQNACPVPAQTNAQRQLAQKGDRVGYFQSRLDAGDPFAYRALMTAKNSGFLAHVANGWLLDSLRERDELSGTVSGLSHLFAEVDQIGVELMQGYSAQLDRPGGMTLDRWTNIHHTVEAAHGLGPSAYGGTPFFGYGQGLMNRFVGIRRCS